MSDRSGPPFRADHVGSLLRPPALRDARERFAAGAIGAAELRGIEDEAITDVVRMQADVGLSTATDGEFRRASWHMDFIYAISGISKVRESAGSTRPRSTCRWSSWRSHHNVASPRPWRGTR